MDEIRNIVVVGASAGGIPAVKHLASGLSATMNAAVVVVLHLSHKSKADKIVDILQKSTTLECRVASHGAVQERAVICSSAGTSAHDQGTEIAPYPGHS